MVICLLHLPQCDEKIFSLTRLGKHVTAEVTFCLFLNVNSTNWALIEILVFCLRFLYTLLGIYF